MLTDVNHAIILYAHVHQIPHVLMLYTFTTNKVWMKALLFMDKAFDLLPVLFYVSACFATVQS